MDNRNTERLPDAGRVRAGLLKGLPWPLITAVLIVLPIAAFVISFCIGQYSIPLKTVFRILLSPIFPIEETWKPIEYKLVWLIRIPRILAAMMVGGSLAMSGASFQGLFRNP